MKEGVKKSISLILVLTLLVQLLPVVAFGVGDETNDLDISTDSETVSMKDDDAEIVGEEDALREESVKHFRLRDGGYMLVEYETAVHYQTADGSWEEIDNTLQKTGQQYVAQAGDMTRKFAASLDSGFLFETAYQGQSVSMSLARRSSRDVVAVAPDVPAAEETAAPEETAVPETADQPQEAEQTEADLPRAPAEAAAETDAPQQETAEELPLLFERFHKSDKSRSEDKDGYGLGLYIVKTILEQHKEKISVTSEDGVTAFSFSLATE